MAWTYRIDPLQKIVFSSFKGTVTNEDVFAQQEAIRRDPDFREDFNQLINAVRITRMTITIGGIQTAAKNTVFGKDSRRAIVVGSDVAFGMARMFQTLCEKGPDEMRVFRNLEDAYLWLGLNKDMK